MFYLHCFAALAGLRQFYADFSINTSTAAVATFLQSTRNDTIAGVSVVFGVPKGVNSNTKPADTKLLIYLHGGGERHSAYMHSLDCLSRTVLACLSRTVLDCLSRTVTAPNATQLHFV